MVKTDIFASYEEMSQAAAALVGEALQKQPRGLCSFPGGTTPEGMLRCFTGEVNNAAIDISHAHFVSLDEWVGLGEEDEGSCAAFLKENLFAKLEKPFASSFVLNGKAGDLAAECRRQEEFINQYGPLTVSVLGIGLNGHLGFNEENVDFGLGSHVTPLSPVTREVMKKYFSGKDLPLTQGITMGIGQIMKAGLVIVLANGAHKADILHAALRGPVTNKVPASILQQHPNCHFILDSAAAAKLV